MQDATHRGTAGDVSRHVGRGVLPASPVLRRQHQRFEHRRTDRALHGADCRAPSETSRQARSVRHLRDARALTHHGNEVGREPDRIREPGSEPGALAHRPGSKSRRRPVDDGLLPLAIQLVADHDVQGQARNARTRNVQLHAVLLGDRVRIRLRDVGTAPIRRGDLAPLEQERDGIVLERQREFRASPLRRRGSELR